MENYYTTALGIFFYGTDVNQEISFFIVLEFEKLNVILKVFYLLFLRFFGVTAASCL